MNSLRIAIILSLLTVVFFLPAAQGQPDNPEKSKKTIKAPDNTLTFATYYPAPFGAYSKLTASSLVADDVKAKSLTAGRLIPSYDSGWEKMTLVSEENKRFYIARLAHGLKTADTLVHLEMQNNLNRDAQREADVFGFELLDYGPGLYSVIGDVPVVRFPLYTKDEDEIVVSLPAVTESEEEDISVRVLMWRY